MSHASNHCGTAFNPLNATHSLIILLKLQGVKSHFNEWVQYIQEYENEYIPKFQLTVEELPWDPHDKDSDDKESCMMYFRGQVITHE